MTGDTFRVFLDRSLGTKKIAEALRALELDVETIRDRYGDASTKTDDDVWIRDATDDGRVLIGADQRIRYNKLERTTICRNAARCFTFPNGNLTAADMIARLERHLAKIIRCAETPGPYVYHILDDDVRLMKLDCADID